MTIESELIPLRPACADRPVVRVALGPGDDPLVEPGDHVAAGAPLVRRPRHPQVAEQPLHGQVPPDPGTRFADGMPLAGEGRHALRFDGAGEVLYATPAGRLRAIVSRTQSVIAAPAAGVVESVDACAIVLRPDGPGLPGVLAIGEPSHGPLSIAVEGPELELLANRIDVRHAGAVLVAGSRIDVEGLTRARAMGVRGVVVGGLVGGDVLAFRASLERQEASIHASPPFALVVLDGYGKRPIPAAAWDALVAAGGTDVGLAVTPPLVLLGTDVAVPASGPDHVRIAAGPLLGRAGHVVGMAGVRRQRGGMYQECARIALDPPMPTAPPELVEVPLADLERNG